MKPLYALMDGNNFFVSCERVFDPRLNGRPVVILSGNDGCVIARSEEAKALGIPMGVPYFKVRSLCGQGLVALSANHILYADMSARMMRIVKGFTPRMEVASVDECFLDVSHLPKDVLLEYAHGIQKSIRECLGLPVSIGIGPNKTLAKLANRCAKTAHHYASLPGLCLLPEVRGLDALLAQTPVEDIWGVGRATVRHMHYRGVFDGLALKALRQHAVFAQLNVVFQRTVLELNGQACFPLGEVDQNPHSIAYTRSFSKKITSWIDVQEAISAFTSHAAARMRKQKCMAGALMVFIRAGHLKETPGKGSGSCIVSFSSTQDTCLLIREATRALEQIFREGCTYRRAGLVLMDICPLTDQEDVLFETKDCVKEREPLMKAIDAINGKFGGKGVYFGAVPGGQPWVCLPKNASRRYTTHVDELMCVR